MRRQERLVDPFFDFVLVGPSAAFLTPATLSNSKRATFAPGLNSPGFDHAVSISASLCCCLSTSLPSQKFRRSPWRRNGLMAAANSCCHQNRSNDFEARSFVSLLLIFGVISRRSCAHGCKCSSSSKSGPKLGFPTRSERFLATPQTRQTRYPNVRSRPTAQHCFLRSGLLHSYCHSHHTIHFH